MRLNYDQLKENFFTCNAVKLALKFSSFYGKKFVGKAQSIPDVREIVRKIVRAVDPLVISWYQRNLQQYKRVIGDSFIEAITISRECQFSTLEKFSQLCCADNEAQLGIILIRSFGKRASSPFWTRFYSRSV